MTDLPIKSRRGRSPVSAERDELSLLPGPGDQQTPAAPSAGRQKRRSRGRRKVSDRTPGSLSLPANARATSSKQQDDQFSEYWPQEDIDLAAAEGEVLSGLIRFNQHDSTQAFVSIPGVPADLFIKVWPRQPQFLGVDAASATADTLGAARRVLNLHPTIVHLTVAVALHPPTAQSDDESLLS